MMETKLFRIEAFGEVTYLYGETYEEVRDKLSLFAPKDIKFNVDDYKITEVEECL